MSSKSGSSQHNSRRAVVHKKLYKSGTPAERAKWQDVTPFLRMYLLSEKIVIPIFGLLSTDVHVSFQVWRPRLIKDFTSLERIQGRAIKFIFNEFSNNYKDRLTCITRTSFWISLLFL